MKKIIFFSVTVFLAGDIFSQKLAKENLPQPLSELKQVNELPQKGTYQIILNHKDLIFNISDETLYEVRRVRKVRESTYIIVNKNIKIKVLPYNIIRAKNFKPINEYSYEN